MSWLSLLISHCSELDVMLENLTTRCLFINATPDSAQWDDFLLAIFIAKDTTTSSRSSRGTLAVGPQDRSAPSAKADR